MDTGAAGKWGDANFGKRFRNFIREKKMPDKEFEKSGYCVSFREETASVPTLEN